VRPIVPKSLVHDARVAALMHWNLAHGNLAHGNLARVIGAAHVHAAVDSDAGACDGGLDSQAAEMVFALVEAEADSWEGPRLESACA